MYLVCIVRHCRTLEMLLPICIFCCGHIHFIEKISPIESLKIGIKICNFAKNIEMVLITHILEIVCLIYCECVYTVFLIYSNLSLQI